LPVTRQSEINTADGAWSGQVIPSFSKQAQRGFSVKFLSCHFVFVYVEAEQPCLTVLKSSSSLISGVRDVIWTTCTLSDLLLSIVHEFHAVNLLHTRYCCLMVEGRSAED